MARFLVTGGCGFIGSHLVNELVERGHQVRVLDNLSTGKVSNLAYAIDFVEGDISDRSTVLDCVSDVDGVFHLAAISSVALTTTEWLECHEINLTGTINVFDAVSRIGNGRTSVVYASSAAVYGDTSGDILSETTIPRPISAYGADKLGCELHARVATLLHSVPTVGLRLFNIYGPRQDPTSPYAGVIAIFADRLRQNLPIDVFGDGNQTRDFVFVSDAVKFFIAAMTSEEGRGKSFNVCTGRGTTIVDLAKILSSLYGVTPDIQFKVARSGDIRRSIGSPLAATRALHCNTTTNIETGLAATFAQAMVDRSLRSESKSSRC